jgi:hypothetical protein
MKTAILIIFVLSVNIFSQDITPGHSFKLKEDKKGFKTIFSLSLGAEVQMGVNNAGSSFNTNLELAAHTGKGYYAAFGFNHHKVPENLKEKVTYLYLTLNKAAYPVNRLLVYSGLGLTLGITPKGQNNTVGLYAAFNMLYEVVGTLGIGLNIQTFFNFDSFNVIPGIKFGLLF